MADSAKLRAIVRKTNPQAMPAPDLVRRLGGYVGLRVLDEKPNSLLIEGETPVVEEALQAVEGWTMFPFARIPVPNTRPRVLKPPSKK
jgi:hypothetical protein